MIGGNNKLQDDLMVREDLKVARRRQMNEERRLRILNAKVRLIGLDVQSLDAQVAEKERRRQLEKDLDKYEQTQAIEIERFLASAMDEETQMRQYQIQQMKSSWEDAKSRKREEAAMPQAPDFDHDHCGPAAALKFSGEDKDRRSRHSQQKEQMRRWIQEQIAEKAQLKHLLKEEEMSYAEMMRAIDLIREATEREEAELRKYLQETVRTQNRDLAEAQRARNKGWNNFSRDDGNKAFATSLPAFNEEDRNLALDSHGHIIRRDMFKGFTEEQKRRILMDNQEILRQKSLMREDEKRKELDWVLQQVMALRAMEAAEFEEKSIRETLKTDQLSFLQQQIAEQKRDRDEWQSTKYGNISSGFFDGFGKSCR